ncbi:MAG: hypothetical protein Q9160_006946 [Pyrenula sp. 1 TL-2023]
MFDWKIWQLQLEELSHVGMHTVMDNGRRSLHYATDEDIKFSYYQRDLWDEPFEGEEEDLVDVERHSPYAEVFTAPWCPVNTTLATRQAVYKDHLCPVYVIEYPGRWDGRPPSKYWDKPAPPYHAADRYWNLAIQQPHFATEIESFYYSHCKFEAGSYDRLDQGLILALRWLRYIGSENVSLVRHIRVVSSLSTLRANPIVLLDFLQAFLEAPHHRSLAAIDFKITEFREYSRANSKTEFSTVHLEGLASLCIELELLQDSSVSLAESSIPSSVEVVRDILNARESKRHDSPAHKAPHRPKSYTWAFSRTASRVNFLERLSTKVRGGIFKYLADLPHDDGRDSLELRKALPHDWSVFYHCPQ